MNKYKYKKDRTYDNIFMNERQFKFEINNKYLKNNNFFMSSKINIYLLVIPLKINK